VDVEGAAAKEFSSSEEEDLLFSGLSAETIRALREFALQSGVAIVDTTDNSDISTQETDPALLVRSVQRHFQLQGDDREQVFDLSFARSDGTQKKAISFQCKGIKKELGQTLASTGLTIWRAAEHLCGFLMDHPEVVAGRSVCELGAGLGIVSILLDKLSVAQRICATDGDEDTLALLIDNQIANDCTFDAAYLLWGQTAAEDFASERPPFDVILAADVVYEEEQIAPLFETVSAIMSRTTTSSADADADADGGANSTGSSGSGGRFILAYARRNVPLDRVLEEAYSRGMAWEALVEGSEPIYAFRWASPSEA